MSGSERRAAAEKLRQRYANHFAVPVERVVITYWVAIGGKDDASVQAAGLPEWTVGESGE